VTSSDEIQRQWLSGLREKGLVSDENLHRAWQHRSEERDVLDLLTQGALISPAQAAQLRSQSSASDSASDRRRFGDYLLEKELSRGGMGVVYRARSVSSGALVALKVILAEAPSIEDQRRFEREVATLIRLSHSNIVRILDSGTHQQRPYLAMDLVEGQSLLAILEKEPLEVEDALRVLKPIAAALQICARSGIIHRDLKPANIMIRTIDETPYPD
jgi:serine/threonine protein kinase